MTHSLQHFRSYQVKLEVHIMMAMASGVLAWAPFAISELELKITNTEVTSRYLNGAV